MPFVSISMAVDTLSDAAQQSLLKAVEDAVVSVEGEALRMGIGVAFDGAVRSAAMMRNCVAFCRVTLVRNALSSAERDLMARNVTEAVVKAIGEDKRLGVWTVIEESIASGEWKIGGFPLTLDALVKLKRGENPWSK